MVSLIVCSLVYFIGSIMSYVYALHFKYKHSIHQYMFTGMYGTFQDMVDSSLTPFGIVMITIFPLYFNLLILSGIYDKIKPVVGFVVYIITYPYQWVKELVERNEEY